MSVFNSATIGNLLFTEKVLGSNVTITYVNGGVAYSTPAVSVNQKAITVTMCDGVTTASAIKTAIEADTLANALVTITTIGSASTTQTNLNGTTLSGRKNSRKAYMDLGPIRFTAVASGEAGNSYRIRTHSNPIGTANSLTTSGTDWTINLKPSGLSTYQDARQIFVDDVTASGLVTLSSNGPSFSNPIIIGDGSVGYTTSYTTFSDGNSNVNPSGLAGDLEFSFVGSGSTDSAGDGYVVTVIGSGVVAGSETVRNDANGLTIKMQTGVSTATQIANACWSTPAFSGIAAHASLIVNDYKPMNSPSGVVIETVDHVNAHKRYISGIHFSGLTNNADAATNLYTAINADAPTGMSVSKDGTVVTLTASSTGTLGNQFVVSTTNPSAIKIYPSGINSPTGHVPYTTNFTGGRDAWSVRISGTGSNKQKAFNAYALEGGQGDGASPYFVDNSVSALTSSFVKFSWGYPATQLIVTNNEASGSNTVIGSFDGTNTDFTLIATKSITLNNVPGGFVYLKYGTGAAAYSVTAIG